MKNILLFVVLICSVSCDPVVSFEKVVQNDSSYDIWLIKNDSTSSADYIKDSVLLTSKESFVIDTAIDIGGSLSQYETCPFYPFTADTLLTRINENPNLKLKIIIDKNANWMYKVLEPGRNGNAECRLILTDNDIE